MTGDTYHKHVTSTIIGEEAGSNYTIKCICGWLCNAATLSDTLAAELAIDHVIKAQLWCRDVNCGKEFHPEHCRETIEDEREKP